MRTSIETLTRDVMWRLGEMSRPLPASGEGIPGPDETVALKVRSLLPEAGARLILEAAASSGEGGECMACRDVRVRPMPSGQYATEVRLPDGFLRLASVKMAGWRRSVSDAVSPDSPFSNRQWSAEPGIAGCADGPMAYLDRDGEGQLLRLLGSCREDDSLEWCRIHVVPEPDDEGIFDFPASLYPGLVGELASGL